MFCMRYIRILLLSAFFSLASAPSALAAQCTLNGKEVPCSQMPGWLWLFPAVFGLIGILGFVFWLWMLLDAIRNEEEDRLLWVLVIVLVNFLGAVIYYFAEKRKSDKKTKKQ